MDIWLGSDMRWVCKEVKLESFTFCKINVGRRNIVRGSDMRRARMIALCTWAPAILIQYAVTQCSIHNSHYSILYYSAICNHPVCNCIVQSTIQDHELSWCGIFSVQCKLVSQFLANRKKQGSVSQKTERHGTAMYHLVKYYTITLLHNYTTLYTAACNAMHGAEISKLDDYLHQLECDQIWLMFTSNSNSNPKLGN